MFPIRPDEPDYARLNDPVTQTRNRYGRPIETVPAGDPRREESLRINGDTGVGGNPNRFYEAPVVNPRASVLHTM